MLISAAQYLNYYKPLPRFRLSQGLWKAARYVSLLAELYRNMQCESGATSLIIPLSLDCHINKLASDKHIKVYGEQGKFICENCSYGYTGKL